MTTSKLVGYLTIGKIIFPMVRSSSRMPGMSVTPRPYHHGNLRPALVAAALATIEDTGPAAMSLREVAPRAGVSHAPATYPFPHKPGPLPPPPAHPHPPL